MENNDLNQQQNTGYDPSKLGNQSQINPDSQYGTEIQYEETPEPDVEKNEYVDPALHQNQSEIQDTDQNQATQPDTGNTVYNDAQNLPLNMNDTQIQELYPEENADQQMPVQDRGVDFATAINNLEPNVAAALSYLLTPFTGILIFLTTPKEKQFVKFHAFQSILFGLVAIGAISISRSVPYISYLLNSVVNVVIGFLWLFLLWKAFNNEAYELPIIGRFAKEQVRS